MPISLSGDGEKSSGKDEETRKKRKEIKEGDMNANNKIESSDKEERSRDIREQRKNSQQNVSKYI